MPKVIVCRSNLHSEKIIIRELEKGPWHQGDYHILLETNSFRNAIRFLKRTYNNGKLSETFRNSYDEPVQIFKLIK